MAPRLTKSNWIEHGLVVLASDGPAALKADTLAKSLKVSRGSFYWHFSNLRDFQTEVVLAWATRTKDIATNLTPVTDPADRLIQLVAAADATDMDLEAAIRSWAKTTDWVAPYVAALDSFRVGYVTQIFRDLGFDEDRAKTRAHFLYAANLGQLVSFLPDPNLTPALLAETASLLIRK